MWFVCLNLLMFIFFDESGEYVVGYFIWVGVFGGVM